MSTITTSNGDTINVLASKNSHGVGGQILINGIHYTDFDSLDVDAAIEAALQAQSTADMLSAGMIRRNGDGWQTASNAELPVPAGWTAEWID